MADPKTMAVGVAVNLGLQLLIQSQKVSLLVQQAQANGQQHLSPDQLKQVIEARDEAFNALDAAIEQAEAEGR